MEMQTQWLSEHFWSLSSSREKTFPQNICVGINTFSNTNLKRQIKGAWNKKYTGKYYVRITVS